jgi:DNA-binding NtrC family response regulator
MSTLNHILLVEPDLELGQEMSRVLFEEGNRVTQAQNNDQALKLLKKNGYQVVICEQDQGGGPCEVLLSYVRENTPVTPVIVTAEQGSVNEAVGALRAGAFDFITKPVNHDQLKDSITKALRETHLSNAYDYLRRQQPYIYSFENIIAKSDSMLALLEQAAKLAPSDATVLLTGETGTGKSLIAGAIHANSLRKDHTLVTVNCAALPETLLESELFGHEKGSFTGADKTRTGRIQQAHGGTLFLDEVGDMSPATQAKMLIAIENKIIQPIGSERAFSVDVRILAATNMNLVEAAQEKMFREDLYYRLSVASLHVPPLRERREDVIPLAERFVMTLCRDAKRPMKELTTQAKQTLLAHSWPGNVRELRNVIERAILFTDGDAIDAPGLLPTQQSSSPPPLTGFDQVYDLKEMERRTILAALEATGFIQNRAAKLLNITPRSLCYRLQKLEIEHPSLKRRPRRNGGSTQQ